MTKLLSVIELGNSSTGEAIYEKVVAELFDNDFDIKKNCIAIYTDGGSNLASTNGSGLYNRLKQDIPSLVHVRDLCHIYNTAEEACKLFPKNILDFVREACAYINRSVQRQIRYKEFIIARRNKRPTFKEIRWLVLVL